jgi:hypothetical protein
MKSIFFSFLFVFVSLNLFSQVEMKPTDAEGLLKFTVADPKGIPEEGAIVKVEAVDKKFNKQGVTDIDGKCAILVPEGQPFSIVINKFGHDFDFGVHNVPLEPGPHIRSFKLSIEVVTTYTRKYNLDHLYFEPNQFETTGLKPASLADLNRVVDSLKAHPHMKIEIAGHTDNSGDDMANLHLSQRRADAVKGYLIQKGIQEGRVLAKGYGETDPISSNDTPEGRSFNRRTEVRIIEE